MNEERIKHIAEVRISNVDKKSAEDQVPVRLCNYTDVYYHEQITSALTFMEATATVQQRSLFGLRRDDVLVTKDSEMPEDIGVAAVVTEDIPDLVCGYHLALIRPFATRADGRFVRYSLASSNSRQRMSAAANGITRFGLRSDALAALRLPLPPLVTQRAIADYLDDETGRIDALVASKLRLLATLYERCDALIGRAIARSGLVEEGAAVTELRRVLTKRYEMAPPDTPMVTAYRDGQVTLRAVRRPEGYTEASGNAATQLVCKNDVVIHGLDGFAGAIGTAEMAGACSPVYHTCSPANGGDPHYWGRMMRVLATTGYLSLFVTSTRERAYDMRNWSVMGRIPVPVVPLEEQRAIGDRLRAIPALRNVFELSIALLRERKQALITNAVTGEHPIPGIAA